MKKEGEDEEDLLLLLVVAAARLGEEAAVLVVPEEGVVGDGEPQVVETFAEGMATALKTIYVVQHTRVLSSITETGNRGA